MHQPDSDGRRRKRGTLEITNDALAAIQAAVRHRPELVSSVQALEPLEGSCRAIAENHELMMPVFKVETRSNVMDKRTDAGFVDLVASVSFPKSFEFVIEDRGFEKNEHWWHGYNTVEGIIDRLDSFCHSDASLSVHFESQAVWFSVRTGTFTLGEVLQELKTLAALNEKNHKVALVVHTMEKSLCAHIEHEGFKVIQRSPFFGG